MLAFMHNEARAEFLLALSGTPLRCVRTTNVMCIAYERSRGGFLHMNTQQQARSKFLTTPAWPRKTGRLRVSQNGHYLEYNVGGAKIRAARDEDGTFAVIYSPRGEAFTLNKQIFSSPRLKEHWYDPRYGTFSIEDKSPFFIHQHIRM